MRLNNAEIQRKRNEVVMPIKNTKNLQVLTETGYQPFTGIRKVRANKLYIFTFDDKSKIKVSEKHRFIMPFNMEIFADECRIGDNLSGKIITDIQIKTGKFWVYDLMNVTGEKYYTNNILSHNSFIGSSYTLVTDDVKDKLRKELLTPDNKTQYNLSPFIPPLTVWELPKRGQTYLIGADVGEGVGLDFSVILVFDVTSMDNMRLVAQFSSPDITTTTFAYYLVKTALFYHNASISMECNSIGKSVIDYLYGIYQYDNLVSIKNKDKVLRKGIFSQHSIKMEACLWLREFLANDKIKYKLRSQELIREIEYFEKKDSVKMIFQAAGGKHDDFVMSLIWAVFTLNPKYCERYFNVTEYRMNNLYINMPWKLQAYDGYNYQDIFQMDYNLQEKNKIADSTYKALLQKSPDSINKALIGHNDEQDFKHLAFTNDMDYSDNFQ